MRSRLRALLVVVASVALLFTQHASLERVFYVASLETVTLALWTAYRERPYPLIPLVSLASCCVLMRMMSAFFRLVTEHLAERIMPALEAAFPMVIALYGSVALGYLTYRGAKAFMRRRCELIIASVRAGRRQFPDVVWNPLLRGAVPGRNTQFHLSTLLVMMAAVAILVTQRHSLPRFVAVGVIEMTVAFGWLAAAGYPFPWNALIGGAIAVELYVFPVSFLRGTEDRGRVFARVVNSFVDTAAAAIILVLVIALCYLSYSVVGNPFQLNLPKPGAFRRRRRS